MIFLFVSFLALFSWVLLKSVEEYYFFNKLSVVFYLVIGCLFLILFYYFSKSDYYDILMGYSFKIVKKKMVRGCSLF